MFTSNDALEVELSFDQQSFEDRSNSMAGGVRILATGSRWPARFLSTLLNDTPTPTSGTCRSIIILRPAVFQTNSNAVALVESFCMRKETIVKYYRGRSHSHLSRGFAVYFHRVIATLASSIPPTAATAH